MRTPSIARWKALLDFLFATIECFRYILRLRRYKRKSVEVGFFEGVGHFEAKFQIEGLFFAPISMDR